MRAAAWTLQTEPVLARKLSVCRPMDWPVSVLLQNKLEQAKHTTMRRKRKKETDANKPAKRASAPSPSNRDNTAGEGSTAVPNTLGQQRATGDAHLLDSTHIPRVPAVRQVPVITGTAGLDTGHGIERFLDDSSPATQLSPDARVRETGDGLTPDANNAGASRNGRQKDAMSSPGDGIESESEPEYDPNSLADFEEVVGSDLDAGVFMLYGPQRNSIAIAEPKWSTNLNPIARAFVHPKSKLLYGRRAPGGDCWRVVTIVELSPHSAMEKFQVPFPETYKSGPPDKIKGSLVELVRTNKSKDFFWATSLIFKPGKENGDQASDWAAVKVDPQKDLPGEPAGQRVATGKKTRK